MGVGSSRLLTAGLFVVAIYWVAAVWDGNVPQSPMFTRAAAAPVQRAAVQVLPIPPAPAQIGVSTAAEPQPAATELPTAVAQLAAPALAPTAPVPTLAPTAPVPTLAPTAPVPTVVPTALPTPAPLTSAQAWDALQPALEDAWGTDTQQTIALLDRFTSAFPDDIAAREKLYAALLARANELTSTGDTDQAAEQLQRARALLPERGEAVVALARLTPAP